jgi:Fe-S cluster assembly protein SufB
MSQTENISRLNNDYAEKYGFHYPEESTGRTPKGLNHDVVEEISRFKNEGAWMRRFRHDALDIFLSKPMPTWGN